MSVIKKTLTLERRKKVVKKIANQYLTVVVISLLMALYFIKIATLETFVEDALRIIALFLVFIFTTLRYLNQKNIIKCITKELKQCEIENRMDAKRKFRHRL